ncbi:MAG: hypothetical protein IJJ99_03140 [Oscillospiraceae bacterium]|nr:hypothetical protein [Oscillospiraceae bacterium]
MRAVNKENKHSFWRWLNNLSNNHRIAFTILYSSLGLWYSLILAYFGEDLCLYTVTDNKKQFTVLGIICTVVVFILIVLKSISDKICATDDEKEELRATNSLLFQIQSNNIHLNECEEQTQIKAVADCISKAKHSYPADRPCDQISNILDGLRLSLAKLISDRSRRFDNDLYISLMYNFPQENKDVWKWGDTLRQKGLSIEEAVNNESSAFHHLLFSEKAPLSRIFYNSKQQAFLAGCYLKDSEDFVDGRTNEIGGSIVCYYRDVKLQDKTYIRAAIGISSYRNRFIADEDLPEGWKNTDLDNCELIKNIDYIVDQYLSQARIELCKFYLNYLEKKQEDPK